MRHGNLPPSWTVADEITLTPPRQPQCLLIGAPAADGTYPVQIDLRTGAVTLQTEPEEAARLFWDAVECLAPMRRSD